MKQDEQIFWKDNNLGLTHTFANGGCLGNYTQDNATEIWTIHCQSGWAYDQSEFTSTVATEQVRTSFSKRQNI